MRPVFLQLILPHRRLATSSNGTEDNRNDNIMYRLGYKMEQDHADRTAQSNSTEVLAQRRIDRTPVSLAAANLEVLRLAGEEEQRTKFSNSFMIEVRGEGSAYCQLGRAYTRSGHSPLFILPPPSFVTLHILPLLTSPLKFCQPSFCQLHFATIVMLEYALHCS